MNARGRERLLGATILVSLGAIFLPMLFDGAGVERREVPPLPVSGDVGDPPAVRLDTTDEAWAFVEEVERLRAADPDEALLGLPDHEEVGEEALAEAEAAGPGLDASGAPRAWSVQLATFAEQENAERLRERLLADGFEAYLGPVRQGGRVLHRVAVGPSLDAGAARRLRDTLAERYELEGIVVRFRVSGGEDDAG